MLTEEGKSRVDALDDREKGEPGTVRAMASTGNPCFTWGLDEAGWVPKMGC